MTSTKPLDPAILQTVANAYHNAKAWDDDGIPDREADLRAFEAAIRAYEAAKSKRKPIKKPCGVLTNSVLSAFNERSVRSVQELAVKFGATSKNVSNVCCYLARRNLAKRINRGVYELLPTAPEADHG